MTVIAPTAPEAPAPAPGFARRHRGKLIAVVVGALLASGLTIVLVLRHLDHQYGPIEPGDTGGIYSPADFRFLDHPYGIRLSAAPGTHGQVLETFANRGSHSVEITSIEGDSSVVRIEWSTLRIGPGTLGTGADTPWRRFPATVPAGGEIRLLVTIVRPPRCSSPHASPVFFSGRYEVHWESLLHSHTSSLDGGYAGVVSIRLC